MRTAAIPREVPAVIAALATVASGPDEVAHILSELAYGDDVVAAALGRGVRAVVRGRARFRRRLAADGVVRARVARVLGRRAA